MVLTTPRDTPVRLVIATVATLTALSVLTAPVLSAHADPVNPSSGQVRSVQTAVGDKSAQIAVVEGQLRSSNARLEELQSGAEVAAEKYSLARNRISKDASASSAVAGELGRRAARAQAQQLAGAQAAESARVAAQTLVDLAAAETATIQKKQSAMVARLATLRSTSVTLERARQSGLQAADERQAAQPRPVLRRRPSQPPAPAGLGVAVCLPGVQGPVARHLPAGRYLTSSRSPAIRSANRTGGVLSALTPGTARV